MVNAFFDGLTVVELADRRNQFVGKMLSDGGARVIQVEPLNGSPGRWCGPFVEDKPDPEKCLDYWYYNTGKDSVCVDPEQPAGRDLLQALVSKADIFLESTPPGQTQRWRLDYPSLTKDSLERLIYVSITDFGQDGPWKEFLANDVSHLALGGQMGSSGYSDPTVAPMGGKGHQAYGVAGVLCLQSIVAALIEQMTSERGQYIDCSIHDCDSVCTEGAIGTWVTRAQVPYRHTGQHANVTRQAAWNVKCADGFYINTIFTDMTQSLWENLLKWMQEYGVAEELEDPIWMDPKHRIEQGWQGPGQGRAMRAGIARLLEKAPSAEEAARRAQSYQLPWAVVRAPEENYEEPHWNQRGFFVPVEHPDLPKPIRYPAGPFLGKDSPMRPKRRAPFLGEQTEVVLREFLGIRQQEVEALRKSEVVK